MKKIYLCLFMWLAVAHAQSGYCSSNCMGRPGERLAPMEFHFDFVHSVDHFLKNPKARLRTLMHCHEAFTSRARVNTITSSFYKNCENALQAQRVAETQ
ncbi:hypothetical protein [Helicobacter suis]|uniref:hypothetical protein n=1 Tax=Helicobacter suis TaxID=104628 RepID=UPI0013D813E9|nr:hypothetical protein [Helicobacter suis]